FTLDHATLFKMVQEVGRKYPGTRKPDKEFRISVASGVVYVVATCRAGAALVTATQDGACIVPRQAFEDVIHTFKGERILSVQVKGVVMTIGNFKMPVAYSPVASPPKHLEWFGPNPSQSEPAT